MNLVKYKKAVTETKIIEVSPASVTLEFNQKEFEYLLFIMGQMKHSHLSGMDYMFDNLVEIARKQGDMKQAYNSTFNGMSLDSSWYNKG